MIAALEAAGIKPIVLTPEETAHGAVESYEDAKKCAALFKAHAAEIDGIIITLPNFGEERGLADALAPLQPARPRPHPGHARFHRQDVHRLPPRQLLRQDVHLQQPEAVRHPLLPHHASTPKLPTPPSSRSRPRLVLRRLPRRRGLKNLRIGAIGARPTPSTPCATPRSSSRNPASRSRRSTSAEVMGRIGRMKDNDDARQESSPPSRSTSPSADARSRADEDGQTRRRHRRLDEGANSPSPPCSAGPPSRSSSASSPAPS